MELVCPAGSLPALKAAVDNGADAVYMGFRNATNARNFEGLNFDEKGARRGLAHAHAAGARVFTAINTYAAAGRWHEWTDAVDRAVDLGVDALILADPGLIAYAAADHPDMRLHLSVQASATTPEAIEFHRRRFGVRRAVLPRVLSLSQVRRVIAGTDAELEVFGFGSLCVMSRDAARFRPMSPERLPTPPAYARRRRPCAGSRAPAGASRGWGVS